MYMEPPQVQGLALPADFDASRQEAAKALGFHSEEEMFGSAGVVTPHPAEGERRLIVIPALFSDSPDPPIATAELRRVVFDGPAEPGTLTDFYAEMTRGKVSITGQVAPWVRTRTTRLEAAGEMNGHGWIGDSLVAYAQSAVRMADPDVDFAMFDDDGPDGIPNSGDDDGVVDNLILEFPDIPGSCGGPGIWPVATFGGTLAVSDDIGANGEAIRVTSFVAVSVVDCAGSSDHTMAVLAHEVGHLFGVGDLYQRFGGVEPEYRRWIVGCFGLMGAGSWGCGAGPPTAFGPTQMTPYLKWFLGWMDLKRVQPVQDTTYELEPSQISGKGLWIPLGPSAPAESFLIEYRPRIGFDQALPAGGVLIYHLDFFHGARTVPAGAPVPTYYHLVEADGDDGLLTVQGQGGDRGQAADVFARDGTVDSMTANTTPSSRGTEGKPSSVTIHSMQVLDGKARIRLTYEPGFGAVNEDVPGSLYALSTLEGRFEVVGGTPPFRAQPADGARTPEGLQISVQDRVGTLGGQVLQAGYFQFDLNIEDANGLTSTMIVPLRVVDPSIPRDTLIHAVLDPSSAGLTADELRYLDVSGEKNGMLDVGDLRAALQRRQLLEPPDGGG